MCKNWKKTVQNGRFWESSHGPQALTCTMAYGLSSSARLRAGLRSDFGTGQSRAGLGPWRVTFYRGPGQISLLCSWVECSGPTSRPASGRVNATLASVIKQPVRTTYVTFSRALVLPIWLLIDVDVCYQQQKTTILASRLTFIVNASE